MFIILVMFSWAEHKEFTEQQHFYFNLFGKCVINLYNIYVNNKQKERSMNIDKYLNNTEQTMNGVVFKDCNAFENKEGICYIGEYGLKELEEYRDRGEDLTDEEIVANEIGSTYDSIIEECEERWEELNNAQGDNYEDFDLNHCAELVFDEADWTYISTMIDQMTY